MSGGCLSPAEAAACQRRREDLDGLLAAKAVVFRCLEAERRVGEDVSDPAQLRRLEGMRLEAWELVAASGVPTLWPASPMLLKRGMREWGGFIRDLPPGSVDFIAAGDAVEVTTRKGEVFKRIIAAVPSRDGAHGEWAVVRLRATAAEAWEVHAEQGPEDSRALEELVAESTSSIC